MKKFLFGMAALVSVSLIFLGCPTESDDSPGYSPEQAAAELAAVLGAVNVTVEGATVTLIDNVNIPAALTVTVGSGVTLDVASAKTLTVNGTIDNNGEITVSGTFIIPALTEGITSRGTNYGTVTVKSGGAVQSYAPIAGSGTNTVEAGGKVAFGKVGDNPVYIVGGSGDTAAFTLSEGKLSYTNTSFTLDGKATLNGIAGANSDSMGNAKSFLINSADQVLTVKAGGELTIAADAKFLPRITENVQPLVGEPTAGEKSAAKVIFKSSGFMWYDAGINFYDNSGTALTGGTYTASADTTYVWTVDIDTTTEGDQSGWKAQS